MTDHELRQLPLPFLTLETADEAGTGRLANDIGMALRQGDVVCLSGDLGAGKSTFTRALIRSFAGNRDLEVPSPTFTLVQSYEFDRFDLSHFDLYRLEEPEELEELGLDDLLETGAALIEWPEKAVGLLPYNALWIQLAQQDDDADRRRFDFFSEDRAWQARIEQTLNIRTFLQSTDFQDCERRFLAGDASLRTFETVTSGSDRAVLMRWPFQQAAIPAPVRAYMEKVHLARDCRAVAAIGSELRKHGFLAPKIYSSDFVHGLILSQDLGSETIVSASEPVAGRYHAAVELLARMHGENWPGFIDLPDGTSYRIPAYSTEAMIAEASLFLDWFVPDSSGQPAGTQARREFEALWRTALKNIDGAQQGWVLRDFHSPNLLWQNNAEGMNRIGLIDFQDTVIGPVAYDLASLLMDARTDISPELETALYDAYVSDRESRSAGFDRAAFSAAYALMGVQRNSKILGIFVRLARRDGKPAYLDHLPRIMNYLGRALDRLTTSELKDWYDLYRS